MKTYRFYLKSDLDLRDSVYQVIAKDEFDAWNYFKEIKKLDNRELRMIFKCLEY